MRYSVAQWSPEYGMPRDDLEDATSRVDAEVEVSLRDWRGMAADIEPADDVVFVDGVRRVDANLWIEQPGARPALGLAATYAAGVVRSNGRAELVDARVERGVFTAAAGATDVVTAHGTYGIRATKGSSPEELWLGIQGRMGDLEGAVAADHAGGALVVVDGPLSHRRHVPDAVGYVKREYVEYLPEQVWDIKYGLAVGRRTPIFLTTSDWSRYSWYLRLAQGTGPGEGLVRCEVSADRDLPAVVRLADRVTATLPRFASAPHKDPRAPENLYPIGGLEREMRRRLGDSHLLFRALRRASAAA